MEEQGQPLLFVAIGNDAAIRVRALLLLVFLPLQRWALRQSAVLSCLAYSRIFSAPAAGSNGNNLPR